MKSKWMMIFGAAACGLILTLSVVAQQGSTTKAEPTFRPSSVALIDVNYIISQNANIEKQFKAIDEKYQKLLKEAAGESQELTQLRELLGTYERNSEKYRETEQQMLALSGELDSKRVMLLRQLTEERIRYFNSVYDNIVAQAERCASHFGMSIVMNYNRKKPQEDVPLLPPQQYGPYFVEYTQFMTVRPIVWAKENYVDLTNVILKEIQKADPTTIRQTDTTVQAQPAATNAAVGTQVRQ